LQDLFRGQRDAPSENKAMIPWCRDPKSNNTGRVHLEAEGELVPGIPNPMAAVQAVMREAWEDRKPRLWYAGIEWMPVPRA
jgi:hypothetical protein